MRDLVTKPVELNESPDAIAKWKQQQALREEESTTSETSENALTPPPGPASDASQQTIAMKERDQLNIIAK